MSRRSIVLLEFQVSSRSAPAPFIAGLQGKSFAIALEHECIDLPVSDDVQASVRGDQRLETAYLANRVAGAAAGKHDRAGISPKTVQAVVSLRTNRPDDRVRFAVGGGDDRRAAPVLCTAPRHAQRWGRARGDRNNSEVASGPLGAVDTLALKSDPHFVARREPSR